MAIVILKIRFCIHSFTGFHRCSGNHVYSQSAEAQQEKVLHVVQVKSSTGTTFNINSVNAVTEILFLCKLYPSTLF